MDSKYTLWSFLHSHATIFDNIIHDMKRKRKKCVCVCERDGDRDRERVVEVSEHSGGLSYY